MGEQALDGRVALVTDGWQGLGAVIGDALSDLGAVVAVGHAREDPAVRAYLDARDGRQRSAHRGRLDSPSDCDRVVREVVETHGRIDVLVTLVGFSAAGILDTGAGLTDMAPGEWDRVVATHLSGAFYLAGAAAPHMTAAGFGRMVCVLGPAGTGPSRGHYDVARSAVLTFNQRLAGEVAGQGVTVNTVATGLLHDETHAALPEDVVARAEAQVPVGRMGKPEEIAHAVGFFCAPESGYTTGQLLAIDGGLFNARSR